jgi:8-oxo-dGTP diphosphatase
MLKCGLRYEGTMKQSDVNNQGICDAAYYVLLADEYLAKKANPQRTITYRSYTPAHLDGVLRLSQEWFHEKITVGIMPDTAEDVASYENEYFHVALDDERVVGYVTAEVVEKNEYNIFPRGASYLRVSDLYAAKEYRSRGIGEKLLSSVEQRADENNVQHIFISSATKDVDAVRKFYQRNGYDIWTTSFYKRKDWDVRVYPLDELGGYRFVVIFVRYQNKWLYCRAKERDTYETAGGRIEKGETPLEAAKRELFEETGAVKFDIKPAFDYTVYREDDFANGQVFLAQVHELDEMPGFEMAEVKLFDAIPDKMRFPQILPVLFENVREVIGL